MVCSKLETDRGNVHHTKQRQPNHLERSNVKESCQSALLSLPIQWNQITEDNYDKRTTFRMKTKHSFIKWRWSLIHSRNSWSRIMLVGLKTDWLTKINIEAPSWSLKKCAYFLNGGHKNLWHQTPPRSGQTLRPAIKRKIIISITLPLENPRSAITRK